MKFKYRRFDLSPSSDFFGKFILKPIIPIKISKGDIVVRYAALIDSGADFCIFHAGIGEYFGLNQDLRIFLSSWLVQDRIN